VNKFKYIYVNFSVQKYVLLVIFSKKKLIQKVCTKFYKKIIQDPYFFQGSDPVFSFAGSGSASELPGSATLAKTDWLIDLYLVRNRWGGIGRAAEHRGRRGCAGQWWRGQRESDHHTASQLYRGYQRGGQTGTVYLFIGAPYIYQSVFRSRRAGTKFLICQFQDRYR
jgi:hypothetical protein